MPEDLAEVVRAAEIMGLRGEELEKFIEDSGNTLDDYQRYMQKNTTKVIVIVVALVGIMVGAVVWWFWPQFAELLQAQ